MYTWIFVTGIIFAFYNAWGGGANDCANSFATAVGLFKAIIAFVLLYSANRLANRLGQTGLW